MENLFIFTIWLIVTGFGFMVLYKKRYAVAKWLNDSSAAVENSPQRRRRVLSRRIEDAEDELAILDDISGNTEQKPEQK